MSKDEALKLALEALDYAGYLTEPEGDLGCNCLICQATAAVKEALAQPEQEPVVGTKTWFEDGKVVTQYLHPSDIYTTPPQRTWVGLTEVEVNEVLGGDIRDEPSGLLEFVRAIEAKLKEKNT